MKRLSHTFSRFARLSRTVRYLKTEQILSRIKFKHYRPKPDFSSSPAVREACRDWTTPALRAHSLGENQTISALNEIHSVADQHWEPANKSKLFVYNLHYFDDLRAGPESSLGLEKRLLWQQALISNWIDNNPPVQGNGWEPYPLSLRVINWMTWALRAPSQERLSPEAVHSLAIQIRFLAKRIEWHLLGNHLFVNAKALIIAGLFFEGDEAQGWLSTGLSILMREFDEQILADGAQFELSPMYHALAVEDVLDLIQLDKVFPGCLPSETIDKWKSRLPDMMNWLLAFTHPDGDISLFNDAAYNVAPKTDALLVYYRQQTGDERLRIDHGSKYFAPSGYARLQSDKAVVLADVAAVGPDYLPGHAHADTLSFEFSLGTQRVIVNGGTSQYGSDIERHRQRSTAAHSTLCLDDQNSSEVWGGFRVGRRARVADIRFQDKAADGAALEASHDGYAFMSGRPVHKRHWNLSDSALIVTDELQGESKLDGVVNFHLHPEIRVEQVNSQSLMLIADVHSSEKVIYLKSSSDLQIKHSSYHPEFGVNIENACVEIRLPASKPRKVETVFSWDKT